MMFCMLYKWFISRSMDTDKALPGLAGRHLKRCPECKSFYEDCQALADRLGNEAKGQRAKVSTELHGRIIRGLRENWAEPKVISKTRLSWHRLGPAMAAAAAVLVVILTIQNYKGTGQKPEPGSAVGVINTETIGWLVEVNAEKVVAIEEAVQGPIQEEIRLLGDGGKAAAEFLLACMPLNMNTLVENDRP